MPLSPKSIEENIRERHGERLDSSCHEYRIVLRRKCLYIFQHRSGRREKCDEEPISIQDKNTHDSEHEWEHLLPRPNEQTPVHEEQHDYHIWCMGKKVPCSPEKDTRDDDMWEAGFSCMFSSDEWSEERIDSPSEQYDTESDGRLGDKTFIEKWIRHEKGDRESFEHRIPFPGHCDRDSTRDGIPHISSEEENRSKKQNRYTRRTNTIIQKQHSTLEKRLCKRQWMSRNENEIQQIEYFSGNNTSSHNDTHAPEDDDMMENTIEFHRGGYCIGTLFPRPYSPYKQWCKVEKKDHSLQYWIVEHEYPRTILEEPVKEQE